MDGACETGNEYLLARLADDLCHLLEQQRGCAREGNLLLFERLGESANQTVAQIARLRSEGSALAPDSRDSLKRLYGELMLVLQTQSDTVRDGLRQLRRFRRVITAYRNKAD